MGKHLNKGLPFTAWPAGDQHRFQQLSETHQDIFAEAPWAGLSKISVQNRRYGYGKWLGFLASNHDQLLDRPLEERVSPTMIEDYVVALRRNCSETAVAIALQHLHLTLKAISPKGSWDWIYRIERRIACGAVRARKLPVMTSDTYRLGLGLMEDARVRAWRRPAVLLQDAERFRDGLMIALLSVAPMRRAAFSQLTLDDHVLKIAGQWRVYLRAEMVKTDEPQDFDIPELLGGYLDDYVAFFRPIFRNAECHAGLWPFGDRPMTDKMVRRYIRKHTERYLGEAITPHRFRNAAATFVASTDPANVRMVKDLLGHRSFGMTEKHYIDGARSRLAGSALTQALAKRAEFLGCG